MSIVFTDELLEDNDAYRSHPILMVICQPIIFIIAPTIYTTVIFLTSLSQKRSWRQLWHLIPYGLVLSLYGTAYLQQSLFTVSDTNDKVLEIGLLALFFIQMGTYLYLSLKQLRKHRRNLPLFVSNTKSYDFEWLRKTIFGLSILALLSLLEVLFTPLQASHYFQLLYVLGFYYIGVQIALQTEVFPFSVAQRESLTQLIEETNIHELENEKAELTHEVKQSPTERKKILPDEKIESYKTDLLTVMAQQKPYLDCTITLPRLGELLGMNTYQISYLINSCFGENFHTLINRYRLEACKQMLLDPKYAHLSILGIAFEAGFNSKTVFNTTFKKETGMSPSEFREQNHRHNTPSV